MSFVITLSLISIFIRFDYFHIFAHFHIMFVKVCKLFLVIKLAHLHTFYQLRFWYFCAILCNLDPSLSLIALIISFESIFIQPPMGNTPICYLLPCLSRHEISPWLQFHRILITILICFLYGDTWTF